MFELFDKQREKKSPTKPSVASDVNGLVCDFGPRIVLIYRLFECKRVIVIYKINRHLIHAYSTEKRTIGNVPGVALVQSGVIH